MLFSLLFSLIALTTPATSPGDLPCGTQLQDAAGPEWVVVRDNDTGKLERIDDGNRRCVEVITVYGDGSFKKTFHGSC